MTNPNNNRPGYKKTPVGWIPLEWVCRPIRNTGTVVTGSTPATSRPEFYGSKRLFVAPGDFNQGHRIRTSASGLSDRGWAEIRPIPKGAILFVCIGSTIGKIALADTELATNQQINALIPNQNHSGDFLFYALLKDSIRIASLAACQAVPILNKTQFESIPVPLPQLSEQQNIAVILSTWDDAINQVCALISAAKRRKKALAQKLLSEKKRLPGFTGKWISKRLRVITDRITDSPASTAGYPVLSITAGRGFVSQEEKFSKVIAGRHIEHYILLRKGEFSYNKGNSYRYPQGCAYRLNEYEAGLVPDVFYSFLAKPSIIAPEFLTQFFLADVHGAQLRQWVNTGVRNNGLLNLNAADFFNLLVPCPDIAEQRAIANVLTTADEEIKTLEDKCAALERQKRGLMQKLLTGELRVRP